MINSQKNNRQNLLNPRNLSLQPHEKVEVNQIRLHIVMTAFIVGFVILALRLFDITFLHNQKDIKLATNHSTGLQTRNEIVDRNGVLLAVNLTTASLYANPKIILDPQEAATKLVEIFPELDYKHLIEELHSAKTFVWIKRNLTPKEQYAVNNLGIPGLFFEQAEKRVYTHGPLLSHVLGYVGLDGKGQSGLEKYFDDKHLIHKSDHTSLQLSLDVRVQNIVNEELTASMEEFRAIGAVGVVMDAKNGEVLASVSLPNFDPHNPGTATADQMFNRFSLGLYEPGSTFKTFTLAMALDSDTIKLSDSYDVNSKIKAARFRIGDFHARGGQLTIPEIFRYSSNIGAAKIILDVGKKKQQQFLKTFGLLDMLDIEIPEKSSPLYPTEKNWSDLSSMTISYGHGIAVTPLHTVRSVAAMVNGGILHPMTFLKQKDDQLPEPIQVLKPETSHLMQKLYRLGVEYGAGRKANVKGYLVGGKTGTADKAAKGGYNRNSRISTYIAAFPITDPKYVVLIMLDNPQGNKSTGGYATAGMTSTTTVGRVISRIGPLLNMETIDEDDPKVKEQLWLEYHDSLNSDL